MAVFPNGAADAIQAGITKLNQIAQFSQQFSPHIYPPISIGIGLHLGHMMVGMVGEANRMQGDAFSDNVNLSSRIEGLTKIYGTSLIISEETYQQLPSANDYQIRFLDRILVKGRHKPISIYEVLDGLTEQAKLLKLRTQADFEQGIQQYRQKSFAEAKQQFEAVLAVNPDDKAARLYLDRIHQLMPHGVPDDWTGVTRMTEK